MNGSISLMQNLYPIWQVPERSRRSSEFSLRVAEVVSALIACFGFGYGSAGGAFGAELPVGDADSGRDWLSRAFRQDLFYATLLKDAGCSTNASKMFHALGSDDIKAKREVKLTDWTKTSWETISYAFATLRQISRRCRGRLLCGGWRGTVSSIVGRSPRSVVSVERPLHGWLV